MVRDHEFIDVAFFPMEVAHFGRRTLAGRVRHELTPELLDGASLWVLGVELEVEVKLCRGLILFGLLVESMFLRGPRKVGSCVGWV